MVDLSFLPDREKKDLSFLPDRAETVGREDDLSFLPDRAGKSLEEQNIEAVHGMMSELREDPDYLAKKYTSQYELEPKEDREPGALYYEEAPRKVTTIGDVPYMSAGISRPSMVETPRRITKKPAKPAVHELVPSERIKRRVYKREEIEPLTSGEIDLAERYLTTGREPGKAEAIKLGTALPTRKLLTGLLGRTEFGKFMGFDEPLSPIEQRAAENHPMATSMAATPPGLMQMIIGTMALGTPGYFAIQSTADVNAQHIFEEQQGIQRDPGEKLNEMARATYSGALKGWLFKGINKYVKDVGFRGRPSVQALKKAGTFGTGVMGVEAITNLDKIVSDDKELADIYKEGLYMAVFSLAMDVATKPAPLKAELMGYYQKATQTRMERTGLPGKFYFKGSDFKKISPDDRTTFIKDMGLSASNVRALMTGKNVEIEFPASKAIYIVDRPWFAKVKGKFGLKPTSTKPHIIKADPIVRVSTPAEMAPKPVPKPDIPALTKTIEEAGGLKVKPQLDIKGNLAYMQFENADRASLALKPEQITVEAVKAKMVEAEKPTPPKPVKKAPVETKELLLEEVRKYKTVKELTRNLEYHGTTKENAAKIYKEGFTVGPGQAGVSTTQDAKEASDYGEVVIPVLVKEGAAMEGVEGKDFLTGTGSFSPSDVIALPIGTTPQQLTAIWEQGQKPPAKIVKPKEEAIVGYRSEEVYGEGYREIEAVVKHEIEELGNEDIINTLIDKGFIKDKSEVDGFIKGLKDKGYTEVIWLSPSKVAVEEIYGAHLDSVQKYEKKGIVISEMGEEGRLVAYKPEPLEIEKPITAKSLVEAKNRDEISTQLQRVFGSYEDLDAVHDGRKATRRELRRFRLANEYMADIERAANDREYDTVERLLNTVKKELAGESLELDKIDPSVYIKNYENSKIPITQREDLYTEARQEIVPKKVKIEKVVTPPVKKKAKLLRKTLALTEEETRLAETIKKEVKAGEAGRRVPVRDKAGYIKRWTGIPSTFPEYFKNKGYTKAQVSGIIDKAVAGKPLTANQEGILNDLMEGKKAELEEEEYYYEQQIKREQEALRKEGISQSEIEKAKMAGEREAQAEISKETAGIVKKEEFLKALDEAVEKLKPTEKPIQKTIPEEPLSTVKGLPQSEAELADKPKYNPTDTLLNTVKKKLTEEKGAIEIGAEPVKQILDLRDTITNIFTRYRNIDEITRETLISIEELMPKKMEDAANLAMQIVGNKFDKPTRRAIMLHMDDPTKNPAPARTADTIKQISELQKTHGKVLKDAGFDITKWPQSKINYLTDEIEKLVKKIKTYKTDKAIKNAQRKIAYMEEEIEHLKGLGYVHRISRRTVLRKIKAGLRTISKLKKISVKPVKFLGRKYNTIEEAEAEGIIVGDITESLAATIYSIWETVETKALIDAIHKNANYVLPATKAPDDWQRIDTRVFPKAKGKKYHPAMAMAIEELTYRGSANLDRVLKIYDKINVVGKFIGFYNPIFMTNYDIQQGWRAAGMKFFVKIPEAIKIFMEKGDKYYELMAGGLFNKVMDYKPGAEVMARQMLDMAEKSYGKRFAEKLADGLLHPVKMLQVFNNKTTWAADEVLRIACSLAIDGQRATKGLSAFQKVDLANDFMAAYNKLPKATKKTLNRVIFTPTYRISMARVLAHMWRNPKRFTAPLMRHYGSKIFIKFVLPTIIGAWLAKKYRDKITQVYSEKGYRVVVKIGDKVEKVYAISGPLLEEAKIAYRKPTYTMEVNLSFGLNLLNTLLNRNKGRVEPDDLERINEYFKIGAPGIREYQNWTDKEKETSDKFLTQVGLAYAYTRLPAKPDKYHFKVEGKEGKLTFDLGEDGALKKALQAMDLWLDWRDSQKKRDLARLELRYRWYSNKLYKAIKRKDTEEKTQLLKEAKKEFGISFPVGNIYKRLQRERVMKEPSLTREEQELRAKNMFIKAISRKRAKTKNLHSED